MPKRRYNTWAQKDMEEAIEKYNAGDLKFNEVCRTYNIPKPTFRRHLKGLNVHQGIGHPKDLTAEMEAELVRHVLLLESRFFGLTITDLRRLAYELAEKYKLPHRFNKETKLAGWKWYYKFMKDHPEISLRALEPTSMARCKGLTKERVMDFFDKYEAIIDEEKFTADQIYNVDETGLSTVHKPSKILAQKGKHQVGAVTSGERGVNTTCICCMNAAGEFIPPMLIFKRKRITDDLKRGGPPNTVYSCSESGWIVTALFVDWLKHFIKCLKLEKSEKNQILLILDGHSTHTKNIDAINLARDYGIIMLSLPAHTTHRLQPLDRSFFKSLKNNYNAACASWMRNHPGSVIKQTNISEILGIAYPRAVCMETAMHGFESCGLWPCNRFKIRDEEYVALDQDGEIRPPNEEPSNNLQGKPQMQTQLETSSAPSTTKTVERQMQEAVVASSRVTLGETHEAQEPRTNSNNSDNYSSSAIRADIEIISPKRSIPGLNSKTKSKMTTGTLILTKSPYKKDLEKKIDEEKKKPVSKNFSVKKVLKRKTNIKNETSEKHSKKKKQEQEEESWFCKICEENRKENMIQCIECEVWVHDLCAGTDKNTTNYYCDDCQELQNTVQRFCNE